MILAIDTALNHCSIAILNNDEILVEKSFAANNQQAEILPKLVQEALESAQIQATQIDRIATSVGPGSFNGIRIGLGFAKSFALALNIECIGVSTLDILLEFSNAKSKIALIESNGGFFAKAMVGHNCVILPFRLDAEELANIEFSNFEEIIFIGNCDNSIPDRAKKIDALSPVILAKLAVNMNAQENPPIPQYIRGADAKLWSGSQYV